MSQSRPDPSSPSATDVHRPGDAPPPPVDWDRLEREVAGGPPRWVWTAIAVAAAAGWVAFTAWISAPAAATGERLLRVVPTMIVVGLLVGMALGHVSRRLVSHLDRPAALDVARQLAEADATWARRMQWAVALLVLFFLYRAIAGTAATYDPLVFFGGLALPLLGIWGWLRHVRGPRSTREARDLAAGEG